MFNFLSANAFNLVMSKVMSFGKVLFFCMHQSFRLISSVFELLPFCRSSRYLCFPYSVKTYFIRSLLKLKDIYFKLGQVTMKMGTILVGEYNTIVSAYTMYRHLQYYCTHPLFTTCNCYTFFFNLEFSRKINNFQPSRGTRIWCSCPYLGTLQKTNNLLSPKTSNTDSSEFSDTLQENSHHLILYKINPII